MALLKYSFSQTCQTPHFFHIKPERMENTRIEPGSTSNARRARSITPWSLRLAWLLGSPTRLSYSVLYNVNFYLTSWLVLALQTTFFYISQSAHLGLNIMPDGADRIFPTSLSLAWDFNHWKSCTDMGPFEGRSTDWATAPQLLQISKFILDRQ